MEQEKVLDLESAAEYICTALANNPKGFSGGKIGTSEFNAICHFLKRKQSANQIPTPYPHWVIREMTQNAGFWQGNNITMDLALDNWAQNTLEAISNLDVVVCWNPSARAQELELINYYNAKAKKIPLRALEPYYTPKNQYTLNMTNGPIAVVSPFAKSIEKQWLKRSAIFPPNGPAGPMWLNNQKLIPITAKYGPVMTAKNITLSWSPDIRNGGYMSAIDYLENEVVQSGAKYAFVGIGCLSLILVSRLKKHGIVAFHTGGGTQIMFGIKGKRWLNHNVISTFFNPLWTTPGLDEVPSEALNVEGGCYW